MRHWITRPLGLALAGLLWLPAVASAGGETTAIAELRVLTPSVTLEPGTSYVVGRERVRTDVDADCNFGGAGGSGDTYRLAEPTALGLLRAASRVNADLRPLSITDEFGFGLAICGIGGEDDGPQTFWNLRANHEESDQGADILVVHDSDDVLFYLAPDSFPNPNVPELELRVDPGATPGNVTVRVRSHQCEFNTTTNQFDCGAQPAQGATVSGGDAAAVTNAQGTAQVPVAAPGFYELQATDAPSIPSNLRTVCVRADLSKCPDAHGKRIVGRSLSDRIDGTRGWDRIRARGGDDRIRIGSGGRDLVDCGGGRDVVVRRRGDGRDEIHSDCERVIRR